MDGLKTTAPTPNRGFISRHLESALSTKGYRRLISLPKTLLLHVSNNLFPVWPSEKEHDVSRHHGARQLLS